MARVTYGESITEYAGSIGGVTFLRNASGPIAKLRSRPVVNPSPDQSARQTLFAMMVAYWPTLSQAQKDLWDVLAAAHDHTTPWGEAKTLSGFQWFILINMLRWRQYPTIRDTPHSWTVYPPPNQFTIQTSSSYIRAAWSPAYDGTSLLAFASLPLRQSSLKLRRSLFFVQKYNAVPSINHWDFTTVIENLFNVTWSAFYASSNCSIIIRIMNGDFSQGYFSPFTSAIVKIN